MGERETSKNSTIGPLAAQEITGEAPTIGRPAADQLSGPGTVVPVESESNLIADREGWISNEVQASLEERQASWEAVAPPDGIGDGPRFSEVG